MSGSQAKKGPSGFTLVDTVVTLSVSSVLALTIAAFLADNHKAFNDVYRSAFCPAAEEDIAARGVFQKTVRQASSAEGRASVASDGSWMEVQYYSDSDVASPDRSARFYLSGQDLLLERTDLETEETVAVEIVCSHVVAAGFHLTGDSAQMFLELDDGSSSRTLHTSAVMRSP